MHVTAPLFGHHLFGHQLLHDAFGIRVFFVDLVYRNDDWHAGRPRVLLLDDCTAALDAQNEDRFWTRLDEEFGEGICFVVSHRLATIRRADSILVVDDGRLVDQGTLGTIVHVQAQKSYPWHDRRPQDTAVDGGLVRQVGIHAVRFIHGATGQRIKAVWGSSSNDVFAVGMGGTILHYDGTAWSPMSSGTSHTLVGVWGSSGSDVFAVGYRGTSDHYDRTA